MSEHESGSFSTNTQVNPKEQCKVITTRRGNVVGLKDDGDKNKNEGVMEKNDEKEGVEKEKEQNDEVVTNEKMEEKEVKRRNRN